MFTDNVKSIFHRVNGSYIFTLKTFLIFSLFGPIGVAVTIPRDEITLAQRGEWLIIGVIAQIVLGMYLLAVAHFLLPRVQRRVRPLTMVLSLLAIGGLLRGVVIHQLPPLFELSDSSSFILRVLNSSITVTVAMAVIGLIFEGQARYIQEYQDLYHKFLLLKRERQIYITTKPAERLSEVSAYIEKVTSTLKGHLESLDKSEISESDAEAVADEIKQVIEKKIRPLSHRLWLDRSNHVLRFKLSRLIIDSLLAKQVPLYAITIFFLAANLIGIGITEGIVVSVVVTVPCVLSIFLILFIEDKLRDNHVVIGNWLHPVVLILLSIVPATVTMEMVELINQDRPNAYIFWQLALMNPLLVILITIINQIFLDRAKILELLDKTVTNDLLEEHLHTLARMNQDSEIATYLHGSLQAELTAIALQLQQAAAAGDKSGVRKMVKMAQIIINRDISADFISHENSPIDKLHEFAQAWQGIAEIKIKLEDTEHYAIDFLSDVSQLIEEAISSAVRFGMATQVEVRGAREGNYFHLTITDNGHNAGGPSQGLGSRILDELAPELWKRKFMDHGTILDIHLPAHSQVSRVKSPYG